MFFAASSRVPWHSTNCTALRRSPPGGMHARAGTEALYKLLQVATECNPRTTVLSVDAVGAFDHVSRQATLEGLRSRPQLVPLLPFARQFYGSESSYVWIGDAGTEHEVLQAEGGEQGDPLMPVLYAVASHAALYAVASAPQPGERVLAFLDDTYIVCSTCAAARRHPLMGPSPMLFGTTPGSNSARARPVFGTQKGWNRRISRHCNRIPALPLTCGSGLGPCLQTATGSLCSVRRSALRRSCSGNYGTGSAARMSSSSASPPWVTEHWCRAMTPHGPRSATPPSGLTSRACPYARPFRSPGGAFQVAPRRC